MRQRKEDKGQDKDKETLFDRLLREKRMKKLLVKNNTLFLGLSVIIALFAAQGMFTIQ